MNKHLLLTLLALLALAVALPVYALREPTRMEVSQYDLRLEFVSDAALMYVESCAVCHGAEGEGIGATPALNTDALREAGYDFLFKTIARGRYDTAMTAWHVDEGGIFNDYQIDELVALIRYVDWPQLKEFSARQGLIPPTLPVPTVDDDLLAQIAALGPDGGRWADGLSLFAENCTVCHGVNGEGSGLAVPLNTGDIRATDAAELTRIITEGVPGTMMASWDKALSADDIDVIVAFLQNWDALNEAGITLTPPAPIEIDLNNPEEVLALGERIFDTTCTACHGENGSGGAGPALNSQQILTRISDEQMRTTITFGGHRPGSIMPAFGDRLTSVEIDALVQFIRNWEPTAPRVDNPRGTSQGGGPPWLRNTTDGTSAATPAQPAEPMHATGTVVSVQDNLLTFRADDGQTLDAMLGPPWYWAENSIALNPGDRIEWDGFTGEGHLETNWITNLTTGETRELRTADGMPVWTAQ